MSAITRNIILDLLPAYIAGEASDDTRKLVDEFAENDAQIARLIRAGSGESMIGELKLALPADGELKALAKTQRRLRRQGWLMGAAICFTFTTISFQIGDSGVHWTFAEYPGLAVISLLIAGAFWFAYFASRRELARGGL